MNEKIKNMSLNKNVHKTLEIVEKRGYNLTIEKLSKNLLGGAIERELLLQKIKNFKNIDFDGEFIATKGNLNIRKCKKRKSTNDQLQNIFLKVANQFTADYIKICPWTLCIMIAGSMATGGLSEDDDIDLDIVVQDNSKYLSYLLAILLGLKYSIKYRKQFKSQYFNFLTKVICISVIWEEHQVIPFTRKDEQIAFELLNAKIIYNPSFFYKMINHNTWLKSYFPQIYKKNQHLQNKNNDLFIINGKKISSRTTEYLARLTMVILFKLVRFTRLKNHKLRERMDLVEKVKYPYGLFDIP